MDRRTFLKVTGACAATTATTRAVFADTASSKAVAGPHSTGISSENAPQAVATPALKKDILNLRLSMPWPDTLSGPSDQLHQLISNLKSATDDRIQIKIEPASPEETFDIGKFDLYFGPLHALKNAPPETQYFSGLPHSAGISATNVESWIASAGGGQLLDELGSQLALKPLLAGHMGEKPGLWSHTPIQSMADLQGRNIAVTSASEGVLRAFGAHPVKIAPASLSDALSNRVIDVAECGSFHTAMSLQLHKSARYVANDVFNPSGTTIALAIAKHRWDEMNKSDQAIFRACTSQSYRMSLTDNRTLESTLAIAITRHHQMKLQTLVNDSNLSWERISDTVLAHVSSSSDLARRIDTSYMAFKNLTS